MFDLVIFDCDGTLVDSEYLNNKAVADYLCSLGFTKYTVEYALGNFMGMTMEDIRLIVEAETGEKIPDDYKEQFIANVEAAIPLYLEPVGQAAEVVAACAQSAAICVASNGERPNVLSCVRAAGLQKHFPDPLIFTKDMVDKGKPAPDLFLHAARKMGANPSKTLVIEDSTPGVKAGKAAGMTVVGFTGAAHNKQVAAQTLAKAGADAVFDRLIHIIDYIYTPKTLVSCA